MSRLMNIYKEFITIENTDRSSVENIKKKYREYEQNDLRKRLKAMANVHTATFFDRDLDLPSDVIGQMAKALDSESDWEEIEDMNWFEESQSLAEQKDFFHWQLEYPEVFYDTDGEELGNPGFDVVLGNPPYLNAWSMSNELGEERTAIKNRFSPSEESEMDLLHGHWDYYMSFMLQSLDITKNGGNHSFILPSPFLAEKYGKNLRKKLTDQHKINSILDFGEFGVFPDVERQCIVYSITVDREPGDHSLRQAESIDPFEYEEVDNPSQKVWLETYNHQIRVSGDFVDSYLPIIQEISQQNDTIGQYYYVNVGATVNSKKSGEFSKSDVVSDTPQGNAKEFFQGKNVERWYVDWPGKYLDYRKDEMSGPRTPEMFEADKTMVRIRSDEHGRLAGAYDEDGMFCNHTVIVCCDYDAVEGTDAQTDFEGHERVGKELDNRLLLAIINSDLISWVFKYKFATEALQGSYTDVWPESVRSFPVVSVEPDKSPQGSNLQELLDVIDDYISGIRSRNCVSEKAAKISKEGDLAAIREALISKSEDVSEKKGMLADIDLDILRYIQPGDQNLRSYTSTRPDGFQDSLLPKNLNDLEENNIGTKLQINDLRIDRDGSDLDIIVDVRYKPSNPEDYETDSHGYTYVKDVSALKLHNLSTDELVLFAHYLPAVVDREEAGFKNNATANISLIKRIEDILIPKQQDVQSDLNSYLSTKKEVVRLERTAKKLEEAIDSLIYEYYGLSEEQQKTIQDSLEWR